MWTRTAGHAHKVVVESIEMVCGTGFLFDVRLMVMRRRNKVMRMLDTECRSSSRLMMRMVHRRKIQALRRRPKIGVLVVLVVTHRSVAVVKPDLLLLLLLLTGITVVH